MSDILLETNRLILRSWRDDDLDPLAEICADPEVMRYFPATLSRDETAGLIKWARDKTSKDGFCFGPVETKSDGAFLGFVGLSVPDYPKPLPFFPCVEVGWRLKRSAWGMGYASEAAREWIRFGFETIGLKEIVSFTTVTNTPSRRVMERIGMTYSPSEDFQHPMLNADHPLSNHVLYRLSKSSRDKQR
ncbi:N-acetyltransferase [Roseibium denhamense]|uniref:Protein N-acetyltransferase, RimJ/RimL family n=2 Tax=Roseibium denhamense TaxID=76305 RepID=A0ABY1PCG1_9HYPH|nr:GNAT family N-acetyltransferase [Roseibium denhamense]MTI05270.1 N-acetyltransferase [Roseibium denhamense]SMP30572.1 Protein N-acetyltransferase, RimJ/RimL family [Roseibium denhamense]